MVLNLYAVAKSNFEVAQLVKIRSIKVERVILDIIIRTGENSSYKEYVLIANNSLLIGYLNTKYLIGLNRIGWNFLLKTMCFLFFLRLIVALKQRSIWSGVKKVTF